MPGEMDHAQQPSSALESQRGYPIGRRRWAISEGHFPSWSNGVEPIPTDTDYASVIDSSVPIVVQHTRLDSRQAENALLSTIVYASDE